MTHFCGFALRSHKISLHILTVRMYFTIISDSEPQTCKPDLPSPSVPFFIIIFGFVIRKNVCTSETFDRYFVTILDSRKSLDEYTHQDFFIDFPSLVYSNNDIKAAQPGGGFSVLQMLSLTIVHATKFLVGDTRQEIDATISDAVAVSTPSLNDLFILISNSKAE